MHNLRTPLTMTHIPISNAKFNQLNAHTYVLFQLLVKLYRGWNTLQYVHNLHDSRDRYVSFCGMHNIYVQSDWVFIVFFSCSVYLNNSRVISSCGCDRFVRVRVCGLYKSEYINTNNACVSYWSRHLAHKLCVVQNLSILSDLGI